MGAKAGSSRLRGSGRHVDRYRAGNRGFRYGTSRPAPPDAGPRPGRPGDLGPRSWPWWRCRPRRRESGWPMRPPRPSRLAQRPALPVLVLLAWWRVPAARPASGRERRLSLIAGARSWPPTSPPAPSLSFTIRHRRSPSSPRNRCGRRWIARARASRCPPAWWGLGLAAPARRAVRRGPAGRFRPCSAITLALAGGCWPPPPCHRGGRGAGHRAHDRVRHRVTAPPRLPLAVCAGRQQLAGYDAGTRGARPLAAGPQPLGHTRQSWCCA